MSVGSIPFGFKWSRFLLVWGLLLVSGMAPVLAQDTPEFSSQQLEFFEQKIRPVLVEYCFDCHSQNSTVEAGLSMDTRNGMLHGGVSGPAVVPGEPGQSLLMAAIRYTDPDMSMPPDGKLPAEVIADLERWIKLGAPDPRVGEGGTAPTHDTEAAKSWWSFQQITPPEVPSNNHDDWALTDIDRFILAKLQAESLRPVEMADKASLLRRVFIDLIGLPPPPEYQERFLASNDPALYEKVVDWLLEQPQFGERWGRHWLDVARYAETTGRDLNLTMPEAWRYRNYVIQAFNDDKPFDQFILEQLAGDLIASVNEQDRIQKVIATGFLAVGPKGLNESDPRQFAVDLADEQIDALSQAFLGMTISCARCHDHKFDPITQTDYTAIAGILLSTETHYGTPGGVRARNASSLIDVPRNVGLETLGRHMDPREYAQKESQLEAILQRRDAALRSRAPRRRNADGQPGAMQGDNEVSGFDIVRMMTRAKQIEVELSAFNPDGTEKARVMGVSEKPTKRPTGNRPASSRSVGGPNASGRSGSGFDTIADSPLFLRGNIENESVLIPRALPQFLARDLPREIPRGSSGRLELAQWIASDENTLTPRVMVNRIWYWIFGRGIVESVDNFGTTGALPSDQQLLDYLAVRFIRDGWSVKRLVREIVLSRVYQLGTCHNAENDQKDPDNRLHWRAPSRRLDAEALRDSVLSASGNLDGSAVSGSLIATAGDGPVGGDRIQAIKETEIAGVQANYRSVYLPISRSVQPEPLAVFDFSDPGLVNGSRDTTIVPPQALYLMNSDFMETQSQAMAARVMKQAGFDNRFSLACKLAYCREPYPAELESARNMGGDDRETWVSICRALLSSADFLFVN